MTTQRLIDDCFAHPGQLIRHDEAIDALRSRISCVAGTQTVMLDDAAGRIIAAPVSAPHPVPLHTNAAVDGYAYAAAEIAPSPGTFWPVAGRAAAGHPHLEAHQPQTLVRILTGAVMPQGTDTVAMQEDVEPDVDGGRIRLPAGQRPGSNVRHAGEDIAAGAMLFNAGHVLRPQDLAALASIGVAEVSCRSRLRIGIVSTGDEIRRPGGDPLAVGEVFDANAPMLTALARLSGAEVTPLGILADDAGLIESTLQAAAQDFDVLLTSGGASRGEEDHIAAVLDRLGSRHFWQIAVKPGRPMMFGQIDQTVVVGLPGNPVAVFVCFLMYVYPMLRQLGGGTWPAPLRYKLPAAFQFQNRKQGRREFWRGRLRRDPSGLAVEKFARDGSGLITGLRMADGLIDIPENAADVHEGDLVDFIPFSEFGIATQCDTSRFVGSDP